MSKLAKICVVLLCGVTALLCTSCENVFSIEYRIVKSWQVSHTYLNGEEIDSTEYIGYAPSTYYNIYADHVMSVMARSIYSAAFAVSPPTELIMEAPDWIAISMYSFADMPAVL